MKHESASSSEEDGGGTATIQPLPVSDELIARLAVRCEEIFPLNDRVRHEISDEEIHEMESLLKRFQPAPAKILFREQCCSLMCTESEREMEDRLKKFSASSMLEFSVCKMAYAMDAEGEVKQEKNVSGRMWRKLAYVSGISVVAAVGAMLLMQNMLDSRSDGAEAIAEKSESVPLPEEHQESYRKPTIFELQGGDERVPVVAPANSRKIIPEREY